MLRTVLNSQSVVEDCPKCFIPGPGCRYPLLVPFHTPIQPCSILPPPKDRFISAAQPVFGDQAYSVLDIPPHTPCLLLRSTSSPKGPNIRDL